MNDSDFKIDVINNLLTEIVNEEGIYNPTIIKSKCTVKGDGYTGDIIGIEIRGENKNNKQKYLHLIVKKSQNSNAYRSQFPIELLYKREICMYNTIFPMYYTMQQKSGIPISLFSPKFYKSSMLYNNEVIVLANMKEEGYSLYERRVPMNEDHVSLVMGEYGRLHALSFAFRHQEPETFKDVNGFMDDHLIRLLKETNYISAFVKKCKKAKNSLDINNKEIIRIYENFILSIPSFLEELPKCVDEYSTILHGDCWTNNMLFKYEDAVDKNKPTKVCFIDFQLSRLGSPVLDLSYFFYACSPKHIIDNHNYYLQLYYKSFSSYLQKLGGDPEKLYPYRVLENHWRRFAKYGLMFATFIIYVMLTENNEIVEISEGIESGQNLTETFDYDITNVDEYNKRVKDIILHFVENDYF